MVQTLTGVRTDYAFGHTVSGVGDVDGDGFDDLLVGAFRGGTNASGEVSLYRGSPTGLVERVWWTFPCPVPESEFGHQVDRLGDVNGDGYADFVVGATYLSAAGKPIKTGGAYVFLGDPRNPRLAAGWPIAGEVADSKTGFTVAAAGDVNGDGYDDVLVGAWADPGRMPDPQGGRYGRVMLFFGGPEGPSTNAAWSPSGEIVGSNYGYSVHGAGDLNGDGYADIVIGSHGYESSWKGSGRVYVYYGGPKGPRDQPDWTLTGSQGEQATGNSVFTAGDVNGDGFDDLIVGATGTSDPERYEGAVLVFYGSAAGLPRKISWSFEPDEPAMFLGHSVATAGDVNHDGYADIIFSAADGHQGLHGEGVVFVFYGSAKGLSRRPNWTWRGGQTVSKYGATVRSAGDINGDGFDDVVAGQPMYSGDVPRQGRVLVHYGASFGLAGTSRWPDGLRPGSSYYLAWGSVAALTAIACGLAVSRYRYRQREAALARMVAVREQAQREERLRISQDLHDQLGAELTQISIASANVRRSPGDDIAQDQKLEQIESTAGRLVEHLSELVWVTKPTNDSLEATVAYLADMVVSTAEKSDFRCTLDIPTELPPRMVNYDLRHDLVLAVKEATHNAIKHSGGKRVRLDLRLKGDLLVVSIGDDGCWRTIVPAAAKGNGLSNMSARMTRHGGKVTVEPGKNGSAIVFEIPLGQMAGENLP